MKTFSQLLTFTMAVLFSNSLSAAILAGPLINPSNGHTYFLLTPTLWPDAELEAISLGGHLVTINDQEEQDWVYQNFGAASPLETQTIWIGLNDIEIDGTFVWSSGQEVTYTNWIPGEPSGSSSGVPEDWVVMRASGGWNDGNHLAGGFPAVVEIIPEPSTAILSLLGCLFFIYYRNRPYS